MSFTASNTSCQLARLFGTSTSDKIDYGSPAHLDNLHQGANGFTICAWVKRTGNGANQHIITKDSTTAAGRWVAFCDNGVVEGGLRFVVGRPGATNTVYTSSGENLPLNKWKFVAFTFNDSLGSGKVKIYTGGEHANVFEVGYSLAQDGSGSLNTDAAANVYVGNLQRSTNFPFFGGIAVTRLYNRALNRSEIETERRLYAAQSRHSACVFDVAVNTEFRDRRRSVLGVQTGTKSTQFLPQLRRWISVAGSAGATLSLNNSLSTLTNSLAFSVSPELSITQGLSSVTNSLALSVSPVLSIENALGDTLNSLSFSLYSDVSLSNTLENCINALEFSVPVNIALSNTLEDIANALDFSVLGYTGLEILSTLADTTNAISFSVSPNLTIATTLTDVVNALDFTVGGANGISLTNTLESILVDLNFEVNPIFTIGQNLESVSNLIDFSVSPRFSLATTLDGVSSSLVFTNALALSITNSLDDTTNNINFLISPKLTLSGTLANVQNSLAFTGYINPDVYFEVITIALKVNSSINMPLNINLASTIHLEL